MMPLERQRVQDMRHPQAVAAHITNTRALPRTSVLLRDPRGARRCGNDVVGRVTGAGSAGSGGNGEVSGAEVPGDALR